MNALYQGYHAIWEKAQHEQEQDGIIDNRDKMSQMQLGDAYKFVQGLPEGTWVERKTKKTAQLDYAQMASHAGLSKTTDPNAYAALVDAINYGEVKSDKDLRSHELAPKVFQQDMKHLVSDLQGASTIQTKDLMSVYRYSIGKKDEDTNSTDPKAGKLSNAESQNFMEFTAWARDQAKNSNRAKEPGYVKELARQWRIQGETSSKLGFGYGRDMRFGAAVNDPKWLPDLDKADSQRIDGLFASSPNNAKAWLKRYGGDAELAKRAFYKYELAQARGPLRRQEEQ